MNPLFSISANHHVDRSGEVWMRITTVRRDGAKLVAHISDFSLPIGYRLVHAICNRNNVTDLTGIFAGSVAYPAT